MKKLYIHWDIIIVFISTAFGVILSDNWKIILKGTDSAIIQSIIHSGRIGISCVIAVFMVSIFEFEPHKKNKRMDEDYLQKQNRIDGRKSNIIQRVILGFFAGAGWEKYIGDMI